MFSFHKNYFFWTLILFFVEVFIGACMHDALIRPYGGDFLVVILLYCLVKSFTNFRVRTAAIGVLLFSYLVETLQYFHIVNLLGLEQSRIACIIIGTSFAWSDLLAYTLGILVVLTAEGRFRKKDLVVTKVRL
ncbi:MAG: DUF2809 domain-containing protein [Sphingobacteriaceae bacterium]|nr:MAG: DUF2809 domain-containing protein [Sphingobacteriaceae bacterium]